MNGGDKSVVVEMWLCDVINGHPSRTEMTRPVKAVFCEVVSLCEGYKSVVVKKAKMSDDEGVVVVLKP